MNIPKSKAAKKSNIHLGIQEEKLGSAISESMSSAFI